MKGDLRASLKSETLRVVKEQVNQQVPSDDSYLKVATSS